MIDEAAEGTLLYRLIFSPDPKREDTLQDLDLWALTTKTMEILEERLRKKYHLPDGLQWVAVEHNGHGRNHNRHIHALLLSPRKLTREDLSAVRQAATRAALAQRLERDLALEHHRQPEQAFSAQQFSQEQRGDLFSQPGDSWEPQAKPLNVILTCPSCGELQTVSRQGERRCLSCGAYLSLQPGKGAVWSH